MEFWTIIKRKYYELLVDSERLPEYINTYGFSFLGIGHHRLAALREVYKGDQTFDWNVQKLTDGQMIQMMARENGESYKTDASVLRETITRCGTGFRRR